MAITTALDVLRQRELAIRLPPPDVLWQIPPMYDDMVERELLRQNSEYYQGLTRAITGIITVPTSTSRRNKKLRLCQP